MNSIERQKGKKIRSTEILIAPEVRKKQKHPKSCLWSLGAIVYKWATGLFPFNLSQTEGLRRFFQGPPPNVNWLPNGYILKSLISGCLVSNPDERISFEMLAKLVDEYKESSKVDFWSELQATKFDVNVLIESFCEEDESWYTVQVKEISSDGKQVYVTDMADNSKWVFLGKGTLRKFGADVIVPPGCLCSPDDISTKTGRLPKYRGEIPDVFIWEDRVSMTSPMLYTSADI
eukprot:TRINITY_DN11063_c0_g1_i3.p1 TRINITY_DN11063_c0_g1~~TRINITY_DN11063_c0_g1_i3.p1  ORF type:complete len:232 (-),score=39.11 TRINITY_DN11063_c0_g1_i3:93-788(-)